MQVACWFRQPLKERPLCLLWDWQRLLQEASLLRDRAVTKFAVIRLSEIPNFSEDFLDSVCNLAFPGTLGVLGLGFGFRCRTLVLEK